MSTLRTEYEPIIYCTRNRFFYFHFFFYSVVIIVVSRISVADYSMAKYTESENKRTRVFHAFLSSKPFVDAVIFRWFRDFDMINSDLEHVELNWKFLKIELNNSMIVGRDDAGLTTNWYDHELETYQFVLHGICSLISCILFFFFVMPLEWSIPEFAPWSMTRHSLFRFRHKSSEMIQWPLAYRVNFSGNFGSANKMSSHARWACA